jgi:hypothetical protein
VTVDVLPARPETVSLDEFYAEDERRRTHGSQQFGFNWTDSRVSDRHCYCEVRWYFGTHEIAAVYQPVDAQRLVDTVATGRVSTTALEGFSRTYGPAAGPVLGPTLTDTWSAMGIGRMLSDRDRATVKTEVRVMGLLEHPIERWWALRDALHLEQEPNGLEILQQRINECAVGARADVEDHSFHARFQKACGLAPTDEADGSTTSQP